MGWRDGSKAQGARGVRGGGEQHVTICARTVRMIEATAASIEKPTEHEVFHSAVDVIDSKAVADFVAAVGTCSGRIDIGVTNSGRPPSNSFKGTNRKTGEPPSTSF